MSFGTQAHSLPMHAVNLRLRTTLPGLTPDTAARTATPNTAPRFPSTLHSKCSQHLTPWDHRVRFGMREHPWLMLTTNVSSSSTRYILHRPHSSVELPPPPTPLLWQMLPSPGSMPPPPPSRIPPLGIRQLHRLQQTLQDLQKAPHEGLLPPSHPNRKRRNSSHLTASATCSTGWQASPHSPHPSPEPCFTGRETSTKGARAHPSAHAD